MGEDATTDRVVIDLRSLPKNRGRTGCLWIALAMLTGLTAIVAVVFPPISGGEIWAWVVCMAALLMLVWAATLFQEHRQEFSIEGDSLRVTGLGVRWWRREKVIELRHITRLTLDFCNSSTDYPGIAIWWTDQFGICRRVSVAMYVHPAAQRELIASIDKMLRAHGCDHVVEVPG